MSTNRYDSLVEILEIYHLDGLALNAGPDLTYLCGLQFHVSERPVVLIIAPPIQPVLIHPELESEKVKRASLGLRFFPYDEDQLRWIESFIKAVNYLSLDGKTIGVSPTSMRYLELNLLKSSAPQSEFVSASAVIKEMRIKKDKNEITAIKKAVQIAEIALTNTLPSIRLSKTEKEIANELTVQLLRAGSEPELPFMPIIASGPNSANPHAVPTDRQLRTGDLLIIDWGAKANGYISDITRTFAIGTPNEEFQKIAETVEKANQTARVASQKGITAHQVDQAARQVIEQAGYGQFFIHRTGHGIGLEAHEEPYIQEGNSTILEIGMVFTIEPGIYLSGEAGVRVEDNVYISDNSTETLTSLARNLKIINL